MIPLKDHNPTRRFAFVTFLIIAVCVVIYVFVQPVGQAPILGSDPHQVDEVATEELKFDLYNAAIPCEVLTGDPLSRDEIARTFLQEPSDTNACTRDDTTRPLYPDKNVYLAVLFSMFFHGSWMHLLGNMLFLWVFGNNIEDRFGVAKYIAFYLASGLVATIAHVAVQPNSTVPIVGASGAIAGVMGAYLVLYPSVKIRSLIFLGFFVFFRDISAKWLLGIWFVLQFFTGADSGVAWMAHVGGFVFGMLIGAVYKASSRPSRPEGRPIWA